MRQRLLTGSVLAGVLMCGSIFTLGCNDVSQQEISDIVNNTYIRAEVAAPTTDATVVDNAVNQPTTVQLPPVAAVDAPPVLLFNNLIFTAPQDTTVAAEPTVPGGAPPSLQVSSSVNGQYVDMPLTLPLSKNLSSQNLLQTDALAALPSGDSMIALTGGDVSLTDYFETLSNPSGRQDDSSRAIGQNSLNTLIPRKLTLTGYRVGFSVNHGPISWTLPSDYSMNWQRVNAKYRLRDSALSLKWNGVLSVPPADGKVYADVKMYDGTLLVAHIAKTVDVLRKGNGGSAVVLGHRNNVLFNRISVVLDLRNSKTPLIPGI